MVSPPPVQEPAPLPAQPQLPSRTARSGFLFHTGLLPGERVSYFPQALLFLL